MSSDVSVLVFVSTEYHSARRDVDNRLYIYLRNVTLITHSVHAYKIQPPYNNSYNCNRHNIYIHPSTTAHAIQEVLHYRNVFFERRSLLPISWCKYILSA